MSGVQQEQETGPSTDGGPQARIAADRTYASAADRPGKRPLPGWQHIRAGSNGARDDGRQDCLVHGNFPFIRSAPFRARKAFAQETHQPVGRAQGHPVRGCACPADEFANGLGP